MNAMRPMRPLSLDYQRLPTSRQWLGFALLAAGVLLCILLLAQSFTLPGELSATEQKVARLRREAERQRLLAGAERQAGEAQPARPLSPSAARWEALLSALEAAGSESVTLLGLEPGAKEISIAGEARDIGAALDYVGRLQTATVFADVHLATHEIVRENPYRPVRFTLLAKWREAGQ